MSLQKVKMVLVDINSQQFGSDSTSTSIVAMNKGEQIVKGNTIYIRYKEKAEAGMEGTTTIYKITDKSFALIRQGATEQRQEFILGTKTHTIYKNAYLVVPMNIITKDLHISLNEEQINIKIAYEIEIDAEIISYNVMTISIKGELINGYKN